MLITQTVSEFLDTTASSAPAPGGGSVSALAGSLGAALTAMVCRLTIGKKKYVEVESEMKEMLAKAESIKDRCRALIDEDTTAFNGVMAAFGLPKESEEQKSARTRAIHEATRKATLVPLELLRTLNSSVPVVDMVAQKGNANSRTDAGVAALLIGTAARGAALNVYVNLSGLPEDSFLEETKLETEELERRIVAGTEGIAAQVRKSVLN